MNAKVVKGSLGFFVILLLLWLFDDTQTHTNENDINKSTFTVSVIKVTPKSETVQVKATGITQSRWPTNLISNVSGKVSVHNETFLPGSFVSKHQLLSKIDDVEYRSEVASGQARISQAALNLARYQHEQTVAKRVNKNNKVSEFGQFKPHIDAANAEMLAAKSAHLAALKRLNETQVKSPFNAIVLSKHVTPGMQINNGDTLFTLASSEALDITVPLSRSQWDQLTVLNNQSIITVTDPSGKSWQAKLRYINPVLEQQTRQQSLVLSVEKPFIPPLTLLPQQHVNILFTGKKLNDVIKAPASVLTKDNRVWTIKDGKLALEKIKMIDEQPNQILFSFLSESAKSRQLVLFPLSTLLVGQSATATEYELEQSL